MNNYEQFKEYYKNLNDWDGLVGFFIDWSVVEKFCEDNPKSKVPSYNDYFEQYLNPRMTDEDLFENDRFQGWNYSEWVEYYCECNGRNL